jgi:hypothetical protein
MMHSNAVLRHRFAIAAAAAIVAGGAAVAAAATPALAQAPPVTSPVSGTATINETLSMSLSASTFALQAGNPGAEVGDTVSQVNGTTGVLSPAAITATTATNDAAGFTLALTPNSDFVNGAISFPVSDLSVWDPYLGTTGSTWDASIWPVPASGTAMNLDETHAVGSATTPLGFWILGPADAGAPNGTYTAGLPNVAPGTYTANFTVAASAN